MSALRKMDGWLLTPLAENGRWLLTPLAENGRKLCPSHPGSAFSACPTPRATGLCEPLAENGRPSATPLAENGRLFLLLSQSPVALGRTFVCGKRVSRGKGPQGRNKRLFFRKRAFAACLFRKRLPTCGKPGGSRARAATGLSCPPSSVASFILLTA